MELRYLLERTAASLSILSYRSILGKCTSCWNRNSQSFSSRWQCTFRTKSLRYSPIAFKEQSRDYLNRKELFRSRIGMTNPPYFQYMSWTRCYTWSIFLTVTSMHSLLALSTLYIRKSCYFLVVSALSLTSMRIRSSSNFFGFPSSFSIIIILVLIIIQLIRQQEMQGKQNHSRVSLPNLDDKNLEQAMEVLFAYQKNCEKTGKYMEADAVKKRLAKMKGELEKQRRAELVQRFEHQRKEVETAHLQEMGEFHHYWDGKFLEYQAEAEKIETNTIEKHTRECQQFEEVVEQSIPFIKRQTSEVINLKKVEEQLAKQEQYVQAHQIQRQIAQIERKQNEKWTIMRVQKVRNLLSQLQNKQDVELSALRQKVTQGFEQQKKTRHEEEEKLIQKYCNFIKELENRHNQEIIRLEKSFKLQSNINFSRSQATSRVLMSKN